MNSVRTNLVVPWGHCFDPSDLALVEIYLHNKLANLPLLHDAIFELDVYGTEPWNLPDVYGTVLDHTGVLDHPGHLKGVMAPWIGPRTKKIVRENYKGYYFVRSEHTKRKQKLRTVIKCGTGGGYWERVNREHRGVRNERDVLVGFKRTFVFHRYTDAMKKKDHAEKTDWILNEYSLNSKEFQPWVLCSVRKASFWCDEDEEFLLEDEQIIWCDEDEEEDEQITKLIHGVEEVDIEKASTKQFENAGSADLMEEED